MILKEWKFVLTIGYYLNTLILAHVILIVLATLLRFELFLDFSFFNQTFIFIRTILALPVLVFWIGCFILWSKYDKNIGRLLLLFFLIGLYNPYYYWKYSKFWTTDKPLKKVSS